jgi:hypothetical protein
MDVTSTMVQQQHTTADWAEEVQQVYDALKLFTELCYRPENQLSFLLDNGPFSVNNKFIIYLFDFIEFDKPLIS